MTGKIIVKKQAAKTLIITLLFCSFLFARVYGEATEPRLIIDNDELSIGSSVDLTLEAVDMSGVKWKGVSGLGEFDVISTSKSSNISIVNGRTTAVNQFHYRIMPKKVGTYEFIGYVEYKGKTYNTQKIKVVVKEADKSLESENANLFMKTKISKDKAYFGEKLLLTYELYSRYRIDDFGFTEKIELDGFITKNIPNENLTSNYVTINGNKYIKYEVMKTVLSPSRTGDLMIPSFDFSVIISNGDIFSQGRQLDLHTQEQEVSIKELPHEGKPKSFNGLVGAIELTSNYNLTDVQYGDPVTLNIKLRGNGNIDIVDKILSKNLDGFTVYETGKDPKEEYSNGEYKSEKEFELIIIPKDIGNVTIPEITIDYFDVLSENYKVLKIDARDINVLGDKENTVVIESGRDDEKTKLVINQVDPRDEVSDDYFIIKKVYVYLSVSIVGFILILILIITMYLRNRNSNDDELKFIYYKLKKCDTLQKQYDLLNDMLKYKYGVIIKASSREKISTIIDNERVLEIVLAVVKLYEDTIYNSDVHNVNIVKEIKEIYNLIK